MELFIHGILTTHYSLLTTHYSLLTTHYSLLTTGGILHQRHPYYSLLTTTTHYLLQVDYFIHGIGTGGCVAGVGKFLKEKNPACKARHLVITP